ncbi:MAG TPA: hypothetical protein VKU82_09260, partial [Planctomycetaceae bacterium]|nr:hypothetical protein [Planctomycetaceae bacterium]
MLPLLVLLAQLAGAPAAQDVADRQRTDALVRGFERTLREMRESNSRTAATKRGLVADVEVFAKAARWALRYETDGRPSDLARIEKALSRCVDRLPEISAEVAPSWAAKRGRLVRGYVSSVDGSVQPYGLVIPKNYNPDKPIRLDVVLHGSTKPQGASELTFIERFDDGDSDSKLLVDQPFVELHPLGRVENCYRWAGETDVFEAIDDVCRKYNIDRDRIVLRGMSMGASG